MKLGIIETLLCLGLTTVADPTITAVTAQQRYPWNGKVDIVVTMNGASNDVAKTTCTFTATNSATQAELVIASVTEVETDPVAAGTEIWTRRYVWDATADVGEVQIADVAINVEATMPLGGVQLWANGPYWAERNVGASKPEEYGYYFWWGDTVGYKRVGSSWNAVDGSKTGFSFESGNCPTYGKDTSSLKSLGYLDATGNLVAAHDAATAHLGAPWRMPTDAEMSVLISNCTTTWITTNGVSGRLVTGKGDYATKSIFLPAAGNGNGSNWYGAGSYSRCWSSMPHSVNSSGAWHLYFKSDEFCRQYGKRYYGRSVRPLREFAQSASMTTHAALDTRTVARANAGTVEQIRFSPAWETGADGAVATVSLNGVAVTNAMEAGTFEWTPAQDGTYTFTHTVAVNGAQTGETLSATFVVETKPDAPTISPTSGTMFDKSLTVSMVCASEDATIHYTTNGTMPTVDSSVYKRFKITGKRTIKAVAFFADGRASDVTVAEYALGQCADPTITPADGSVFTRSGQTVTIARNGDEGVVRYTLDGTEPTVASAAYAGPFTIDDSTVVKAKVFSDRYFDSTVVTASLTRIVATVATPVITAASTFTGSETKVEIACATPGAVIRYTTNGNEPNSHSAKYTGPFWVDASCTVKAFATCTDYLSSDVATCTITKEWGIGDTMGAPDHAFTTSGDAAFYRVEDETALEGEAMRSGAIGNSDEYGTYTHSVLSTTVQGPGTVHFQWRSSCEQDDDYEWDHAEFAVDGVTVAWINGVTNWLEVIETVTGAGTHTLTWTYLKDDAEFEGEDCVWVADFAWTSDEPYTHDSDVAVPYAWIRTHYPHTPDEYAAYELAVTATAANGHNTVEEAYVAGLDPTSATSELEATVVCSNGMVYVGWTPNLNTGAVSRIYTLYGRTDLTTGDWETPIQPWHRFFKVAVAMPTGAAGEETSVAGEGFVPQVLGGVQLWKDGPYWAECNVGASKPEEYGYYFWWGDTVGYKRNASGSGWVSVKDGVAFTFSSNNCPTYDRDTSSLKSLGYIDSTGNLVATHDAAMAHLGAPWRMPTSAEIDALISNCTTTWITTNGVAGRLFTGKGDYASKSIFLPAAGDGRGSDLYNAGSDGYYWSSSPRSGYSNNYAWSLYFLSSDFYRGNTRYYGQSVRPLREFAQ